MRQSRHVLVIPAVGPIPEGLSESLRARGLLLRLADSLPVSPDLLPELLILNLEALADPGERSSAFAELVRLKVAGSFAAVPTLVLDPRDPTVENIIGWAAGVDAYLRMEHVPETLSAVLDRLLASTQ